MFKRISAVIVATVVSLSLAACASNASTAHRPVDKPVVTLTTPVPSTTPAATATSVPANLPVLTYESVLPTLLPAPPVSDTALEAGEAYKLRLDAPVSAAPGAYPIAMLPKNLGWIDQPTQIMIVGRHCDWVEVLTPARRTLPSKDPSAPSSTAAWIPSSYLVPEHVLSQLVRVSVAHQTLSIIDTSTGAVEKSWGVATGDGATPSPVGLSYLEARFSDPARQAGEGVISMTSLHVTASDSFYGDPAGLVALHAQPGAAGDRSHGCVRMPADAEQYISGLPLGTIVEIAA